MDTVDRRRGRWVGGPLSEEEGRASPTWVGSSARPSDGDTTVTSMTPSATPSAARPAGLSSTRTYTAR